MFKVQTFRRQVSRRLHLNLSRCFTVGSRSPVTFKTKLFVKTTNSSFQISPLFLLQSPIFCHKAPSLMLLRAWTEYCNIIHKNSKRCRLTPPIIECNLRKIWKTHSPRYPKMYFQRFFASSFLHLISDGLNGVNTN